MKSGLRGPIEITFLLPPIICKWNFLKILNIFDAFCPVDGYVIPHISSIQLKYL